MNLRGDRCLNKTKANVGKTLHLIAAKKAETKPSALRMRKYGLTPDQTKSKELLSRLYDGTLFGT